MTLLSIFMQSVVMLSAIMLSVVMLSVVILSVVMLSVIILNVVMLSVAAPLRKSAFLVKSLGIDKKILSCLDFNVFLIVFFAAKV